MSAEIDAYKEFIDGLVNYQGSVSYILKAFSEKRWNHRSSHLLDHLTDEVRQAIASVIRKIEVTAIHDVLVYMTDRGCMLSQAGISLPERPFDNTLYYDFVARDEGLPWPDSEENGDNEQS